jgi:hypothetical protein
VFYFTKLCINSLRKHLNLIENYNNLNTSLKLEYNFSRGFTAVLNYNKDELY